MMKLTVPKFRERKTQGKKISMITAYDFPSARLVDQAGVDVVLVGDSLGNVVQGKPTTLSVTLREIMYHAEMVVRGVQQALVIVDLPFPYAQLGSQSALKASAQILKRTNADAVKIEGGENRSEVIRTVVQAGIPVMGHCGLLPQEVKKLGTFSKQRDRDRLVEDVRAIEAAGAFGVVLECIPEEIAGELTELVGIPTIGIGSGKQCDGQVLVFHDMLGLDVQPPKHAKVYAPIGQSIIEAVKAYCNEVYDG